MSFDHSTPLLNPQHLLPDAEEKLGEDAAYHVQFRFNLLDAPEGFEPCLSDGDHQCMVEAYAEGITSGEMEYIHYDEEDIEHTYRLTWELDD